AGRSQSTADANRADVLRKMVERLARGGSQLSFCYEAGPCGYGLHRFLRGLGMPDYGHAARVKNGPALAGHGADAVRDAITRTIITLPEQLRRSLTCDQGAEMAQ